MRLRRCPKCRTSGLLRHPPATVAKELAMGRFIALSRVGPVERQSAARYSLLAGELLGAIGLACGSLLGLCTRCTHELIGVLVSLDEPGGAELLAPFFPSSDRELQGKAAVVKWNAAHPLGTPVAVRPIIPRPAEWKSRTRSPAWQMPSDAAVVEIEGRDGGYSLAALDVLTEAEFAASSLPLPPPTPASLRRRPGAES